ncbi:MAG: undecaprenyl-diphosphate phosphatase [Eubacteriales bacterium]|nr:undecaprenyl-diphosphate phosphatase [Eubacteriales bacterium]
MLIIDMIKSLVLGIVEGITEWLPISSTGHMILVNSFIRNTDSFTASDLYLYVIQLGAILAVVTLYFKKLNPFAPSKTAEEKADTWGMWFKVIVACLPAAVIGLLLDPVMERIENPWVVASMLIVYGIGFILVENMNKKEKVTDMKSMSYKTALLIGMFQVLSIIPGTSRSGATILGAIIIGCSRSLAAEFSFFLAIPVMFGVSLLKILKYGLDMPLADWAVLLVGMAVAYIVSVLAIRFLMDYVRKHDFKAFGWYRIILGIIVLVYFSLI